jgi:CDP-diacylglycerol--serine O-phosphatidyltransferase
MKLPPRNRDPYDPKIYLLPNLMTAGNLFCGFAATLQIFAGTLVGLPSHGAIDRFHDAIWFILAACVFDLLDGRLARLGGHESPFGREFDSLADVVSFGIAPALLVYKIVLDEFDRIGLVIAFVYLACGALRLARFNCIAAASDADTQKTVSHEAGKQFKGFPIPAAAGLIASLTEFMLWLNEGNHEIGGWKFALPPLMLFLSFMMFSQFSYPSFKAINWRTQRSLPTFLCIIVVIIVTVLNYQWMPAVIFFSYLMYGFLRPWLSRSWRRGIEQEADEETEPAASEDGDDDDDEESAPAPVRNGHL